MTIEYGDYIVFVDESGDHGMKEKQIDEQYPIFVLVFVIIKKEDYLKYIVPRFLEFKFKYWGHENIILHEREIRLQTGNFSFLRNKDKNNYFFNDLNLLMKNLPFQFISSIINKHALGVKHIKQNNPYQLALSFCMNQLSDFFHQNNQSDKKSHLLLEKRGKNEDKDLEFEFYKICKQQSKLTNCDIIFSDKKSNSIGVQIADMIARPLGVSYLMPQNKNRAIDIVRDKQISVKHYP